MIKRRMLYLALWSYGILSVVAGLAFMIVGGITFDPGIFWGIGVLNLLLGAAAIATACWWTIDTNLVTPQPISAVRRARKGVDQQYTEFLEWKNHIPTGYLEKLHELPDADPDKQKGLEKEGVFTIAFLESKGFKRVYDERMNNWDGGWKWVEPRQYKEIRSS